MAFVDDSAGLSDEMDSGDNFIEIFSKPAKNNPESSKPVSRVKVAKNLRLKSRFQRLRNNFDFLARSLSWDWWSTGQVACPIHLLLVRGPSQEKNSWTSGGRKRLVKFEKKGQTVENAISPSLNLSRL